ncbi:PIN domain-containing protein [Archaeoglobales archaeon]|nr:MAG: PIN domain-containing protein [Archaeoglobales archaeon]
MPVVDTSVFVDSILEYDKSRTKMAEDLLEIIQNASLEIVDPFLFKVELVGVLSRKLPRNRVELIVKDILEDVRLIPNPDDLAFEVAIKTGSRAADAYFIATAKLTNSILITNDKIMVNNARGYGIEAYYLIEEFDKAVERLKEIK